MIKHGTSVRRCWTNDITEIGKDNRFTVHSKLHSIVLIGITGVLQICIRSVSGKMGMSFKTININNTWQMESFRLLSWEIRAGRTGKMFPSLIYIFSLKFVRFGYLYWLKRCYTSGEECPDFCRVFHFFTAQLHSLSLSLTYSFFLSLSSLFSLSVCHLSFILSFFLLF